MEFSAPALPAAVRVCPHQPHPDDRPQRGPEAHPGHCRQGLAGCAGRRARRRRPPRRGPAGLPRPAARAAPQPPGWPAPGGQGRQQFRELPGRPAHLGPGDGRGPGGPPRHPGHRPAPAAGGGRDGQRAHPLRARRAPPAARPGRQAGDQPAARLRPRGVPDPAARHRPRGVRAARPAGRQPRATAPGRDPRRPGQGRAHRPAQPRQPGRNLRPQGGRPHRRAGWAGAGQQRRGERGDPPPAARHLAALQGGAQGRRGGDHRALPAPGPGAGTGSTPAPTQRA